MKKRAIFLDRDGTLNPDKGYIGDPEDMELLPGVGKALKLLQEKDFLLIVITNQSGVGRGYYTQKDVEDVHARLSELLAKEGVKIDRYYYCPHLPEEGCCCRKPSPELVLAGAKFFNVDMSKSFFVGDKTIDVQTGWAAQSRSVWVNTSQYELVKGLEPDFKAQSLNEAAEWILKESNV